MYVLECWIGTHTHTHTQTGDSAPRCNEGFPFPSSEGCQLNTASDKWEYFRRPPNGHSEKEQKSKQKENEKAGKAKKNKNGQSRKTKKDCERVEKVGAWMNKG